MLQLDECKDTDSNNESMNYVHEALNGGSMSMRNENEKDQSLGKKHLKQQGVLRGSTSPIPGHQ